MRPTPATTEQNDDLALLEQDFSFLGRGKAKGDFVFAGITHLAGEVEGKITMDGEADLFLERTALIRGEIHAKDINIYGEFKGTIFSQGRIVVYPPAKISGKIHAKNLIVYPGAVLDVEYHSDDGPGSNITSPANPATSPAPSAGAANSSLN